MFSLPENEGPVYSFGSQCTAGRTRGRTYLVHFFLLRLRTVTLTTMMWAGASRPDRMLAAYPMLFAGAPSEEVVDILAESLLWLTLRGLKIDARRAAERNIAVRVVIGDTPDDESES